MALVGNIKGPQGDIGATGATGAAGSNGTDGTVWHNGTVDPSAATSTLLTELTAAKTGDYYLNTTSGDVFKKTQAAGTAWT